MFNFLKGQQAATEVNTEQEGSEQKRPFTDIRQQWKALAVNRTISKEDIAALCIYRALVKEQGKEGAISRLRKSFKPITNPVKLANGADPNFSLKMALWGTRHSVLITWLEPEEQKILGDLSKELYKEKF